MENNVNFLNEQRNTKESKICPSCGEICKNIRRETQPNNVFLYKYVLVCISCKKAFLKQHNTANWDLIYFTKEDEVKISGLETFFNKKGAN